MQCYKEITLMLDHFYQNFRVDNATGADRTFGQSPEKELEKNLNIKVLQIVENALQTNDQLLHIAVYDWLLSHKLLSELLNISEPSLGEFLTHSFDRNPDNLHLADILWKYHERNGQHSAATNILDSLASMQSNSISLAQRIEYLARAVMCMRCDTVGYSAHNGILLKNLEDKVSVCRNNNKLILKKKCLFFQLEIARVQKLLYDALITQNSSDAREAAQILNFNLYNITQLYTDFAEPFALWECKLTILNCSHHNDPLLIESVWTQILNQELDNQIGSSSYEKSSRLLSKVQTLAQEYGQSGHCFPVPFLVKELELRCCQLRLEQSPVPDVLIAMGIDIDRLLDIYSSMISMNERIWSLEGNEWHLVQASTRLVSIIASQPTLISIRNRRRLISKALEFCSCLKTTLYPKPDTKQLVDALIEIEAKLNRIY